MPALQGEAFLPILPALLRGDVVRAQRAFAVRHHPDKGGDAAVFQDWFARFERVLCTFDEMSSCGGERWDPIWDGDAQCFAWRERGGGRVCYDVDEMERCVAIGARLSQRRRRWGGAAVAPRTLAVLDVAAEIASSMADPAPPADPSALPFAAKRKLFDTGCASAVEQHNHDHGFAGAGVCGTAVPSTGFAPSEHDPASDEASTASLSDPDASAGSLSDSSSRSHTDDSSGSSVGPLWSNKCLQAALVALLRTAKERRTAKAYFAEVCANNSCAGVAAGAVERQNFQAVLAFFACAGCVRVGL